MAARAADGTRAVRLWTTVVTLAYQHSSKGKLKMHTTLASRLRAALAAVLVALMMSIGIGTSHAVTSGDAVECTELDHCTSDDADAETAHCMSSYGWYNSCRIVKPFSYFFWY